MIAQGYNVGLVPDGISGMFFKATKDEEICELKNRKGVAKLALETGCNVVPSYGFGNTQAFDAVFDAWGIMKTLSKKLRMSLIGIRGRWGITTFPKKVPLYYAVGRVVKNPYAPQKIVRPTKEQIDELHEAILNEIQLTFDTHKHVYGWSHKQLVFV